MNTGNELPADVIAELEAGRKISAIKLLRVQQGIDLKDAKALVDGYLQRNPTIQELQAPESDTGIGRIVNTHHRRRHHLWRLQVL